MIDRKIIKKKARYNVKKHILSYIILCIALAVFTNTFTESLIFTRIAFKDQGIYLKDYKSTSSITGIVDDLVNDNWEAGEEKAKNLEQAYKNTDDKGTFARNKGVFASIINFIASGNIIITLANAVNSIVKSESLSIVILVLGALLIRLLLWFFIENVIPINIIRFFLEGRTYQELDPKRSTFIKDSKNWINSCLVMLVTFVFQTLWSLTIIGGIIKHYSYSLVPYILAENPSIKPLDAIGMSRQMMDGHKMELFLMDLSFIGWKMLEIFSLGLTGLLYSNPYYICCRCEFFVALRSADKYPQLNDKYLYEKAPDWLIEDLYPEAEYLEELAVDERSGQDFKSKLSYYFGICLDNDEYKEEDNIKYWENRIRMTSILPIAKKEAYPERLSPFYNGDKKSLISLEKKDYLRQYRPESLIAIFFIFAFVGWIWEILYRLILDGVLINRGSLFGPWIPIYGLGGVLILMILYRFRDKPLKHFTLSLIVAGILEYSGSLMLEKLHGGKRWWDYTGYFLNIKGRITAEALIFFATGGMLAVYFLAPFIDDLIKKLPRKKLRLILFILLFFFSIDVGYSFFHPNQGRGITD